jgi:hypothetical protein
LTYDHEAFGPSHVFFEHDIADLNSRAHYSYEILNLRFREDFRRLYDNGVCRVHLRHLTVSFSRAATRTNATYSGSHVARRTSFMQQQQNPGAQRLDPRLRLAQQLLHPSALPSGQRNVYAHRRGTSLVWDFVGPKPFIHQMVPLFDPTSVQAI